MSAGRGQTLSKMTGIVALIKDWASERLSFLRNATIRGVRVGEEAESGVSLSEHTQHQKVEVLLVDGHVNTDDIEPKLRAYDISRTELLSQTPSAPGRQTNEEAEQEAG